MCNARSNDDEVEDPDTDTRGRVQSSASRVCGTLSNSYSRYSINGQRGGSFKFQVINSLTVDCSLELARFRNRR